MKTFEEIYSNIYNASKIKLYELKSKNNKFIVAILVIEIIINLFVYFYLEKIYMSLSFSLSVCLLVFLVVNYKRIYRDFYKRNVIENLVKEYNKELNFDSKIGISKLDYLSSKFDRKFDEFYSEDRIYGKLKNNISIQISEIATFAIESYMSGGERRENKTQTFRGMYGFVELEKSIKGNIIISKNSNIKKFDKDRIEIDSAEFEKYYDCFSDNKILAMQIFTSDLIEKYVDIASINDCPFELKIVNNKIYFRYECGQMFEPPTFKNDLDEKIIRQYYMLIFYPMEVLDKTIESIYSLLDI